MTPAATFGPLIRRVRVDGVTEDASEVRVSDGAGWTAVLDGTIRPKGSAPPAENEVWLIERIDSKTWILKALEKAGAVDLGTEVNAIVAAEIERQIANRAEQEALLREREAALAAGILDGEAVVLIQSTAPGPEHQNAQTLWIDTTNDLDRPMRWDGTQWVVVVDATAIRAAKAAADAREAATNADTRADAAEAAAAAAQQAANDAVQAAENALAAAAGKGRVIYGDPTTIPGEPNSLLIGPGNRLYRWDGEAWVEMPDALMLYLQDELDALIAEVNQNITDLATIQSDLTGVQGRLDGKSTIWPLGSSPVLGQDDLGDLRLIEGGGVEFWDGDSWEPADPRVAAAVNEAAEALGLANTKSTTYYKATAPTVADIEAPETAFSINDLWLRTTDNRLHRWDGENWVEVKDKAIGDLEVALNLAISDIQGQFVTIEGKIDGKATVYIQDTAPTDVAGPEDKGDIWIDTNNGLRVYKVWSGSEWQIITDPEAIKALERVDTKITTYYSATEPTGTVQTPLSEGDLWVRSTDNRLHRYDGAAWVAIDDIRLATHAQVIQDLQDELLVMDGRIDGKAVVYVQDADPSAGANPSWNEDQTGDIWIDTGDGQRIYKVWVGSGWQVITDPVAQDALSQVQTKIVTYYATQLTSPVRPNVPVPLTGFTTGDLWINQSANNQTYRYDGTAWVLVADTRIASQSAQITALQGDLTSLEGQVDGKAVIHYQPLAPTDLGTADQGDIWIDSDANPQTYQVWSGTAWTDVTDQTAIDALSKVTGKTTTYFASALSSPTRPNVTAPAGGFTVGDLWVNSADKRTYRWDGSAWSDVTYIDPRVATLSSTLTTVQGNLVTLEGKVDGKATIYYQTTAPTGLGTADAGDIWIDSDANPKTYKSWSGTAWVDVTDATAIDALNKVVGKTTTYFASALSSPTRPNMTVPAGGFTIGDLWVNSADKKTYRFDGSAWVDVTYVDPRVGDQALLITELQGQYTDLNGLVDSKAVIHYQPSAPTGLGAADAGDIWIDSDANPKTYKTWSGTGWVDVTDATAIDALSKVNGKITTFYASQLTSPTRPNVTPPTGGFTAGDLWVNSSLSNRLFRFDGSSWVEIADGRIAALSLSLSNLQGDLTSLSGRVDGKAVIHYQTSAPTLGAADKGDIWIDSDANPKTYKVWSGTAWQDVTDQTAIDALEQVSGKVTTYYATDNGSNAPNIPLPEGGFTVGDLWLDQSAGNALHRYDGTAWVLIGLGKEAIDATARDLGGVAIVAQATAPSNPKVGDLWIDISQGNILKQYDGFAWVPYQDAAIQEALNLAQSYADTQIANKTNLIDNPSRTGEVGRWTTSSGTQAVVSRTIDGATTQVLESTATASATNFSAVGADNMFDIDPTKAYQVSMWLEDQRLISGTQMYFGFNTYQANGTTETHNIKVPVATGVPAAPAGNPYFKSWNTDAPVGTPIRVVGYLMPAGTDPAAMKSLGIGVTDNWILRADARKGRVRVLNWANTSGSGARKIWIGHPTVVEVDPIAVLAANAAQATADGKIRLFSQPTPPEGLLPEDVGDLWINTAEDNRIYTWGLGEPTTSIGSVNAVNHALNPEAVAGGARWNTIVSGSLTPLPSYRTDGASAFGGASTYVRVMSAGTGSLLLSTSVGQVADLSGRTVTASVYSRMNRSIPHYIRITATGGSTPVAQTSAPRISAANAVGRTEVSLAIPAGTTQITVQVGTTDTARTTGRTLDASAVMVTVGDAPYFSGNTPNNSSNNYSWGGKPHASVSHRKPIIVTPAGYQWIPRPVGNDAIDPGSLVGDDVIKARTISADLFRAVMILTSRLVSGDEEGVATEVNDHGVGIYTVGEDGTRVLDSYLGHEGDQRLMLTGSYQEEGSSTVTPIQFGFDDTGAGMARTFNSLEDIRVGGQLLMGAWSTLKTADPSGDRESILWNQPWGVVGEVTKVHNVAAGRIAYSNQSQMMAYDLYPLLGGRVYRFNFSPIHVDIAGRTSASNIIIRLYKTEATYGSTPSTPPAFVDSHVHGFRRYDASYTSPIPVDTNFILQPSRDELAIVGFSLAGIGCDASIRTTNYTSLMYCEDLGANPGFDGGGGFPQTSTPPSGSPPVVVTPPKATTYTSIWEPTFVRQYQGGSQGWGTWNGVAQVDKMGQGRFEPHYTDRNSVAYFSGGAVSGEVGKTITSALNGATVSSVKVRITSYVSARASVKARIGWTTSYTGTPGTFVRSGSMSAGATTTTALPEATHSWIKGSTGRYITIGPGEGTSRADYAFFHGKTGSSKQRMQLIVTYSR